MLEAASSKLVVFFFSSRRRHTICLSDWSSDVCSSDLAPVDWRIVGLGNPGTRYAGTRHNIGFDVANALGARWDLPRAKTKYRGLFTEGRAGVGGPRVAMLLPQTYMNEAGESVGPARGALK